MRCKARPATPLAACVQRISCTSHRTVSSVDETNKNWPRQRSLGDRNTNFRLIIYSHISTNRKNSAKIGPIDAEIITCIGLRGIVKNKKQQQNI